MTADNSAANAKPETPSADDFSASVESAIEEVFAAKESHKHEPASEDASAALQEENKQLKDQLLRAIAEMENVRKRAERDVQDARKYSITGFARDLVNVLENLQLALLNIPAEDRKNDEKLATLAEGVEMTANELLRVFQNQNITRLNPVGEKFDHNFHQAVAQVDDPSKEPGTIVQVLQAGYVIHDRLLRPAMVTVASSGGSGSASVNTQA